MNKKTIVIFSIAIAILSLLITIILINNNSSKTKEEMLNKAKNSIKELIKYTNKNDFKKSGVLNVNAKYKGAHGEHYPKEFVYNFKTNIEDDNYTVIIGNEEGYFKKTYKAPGVNLMNKIKNIDPSSIDKIFKTNIDIKELNKILDTDYKKCSYKYEEEIMIICDDDYIEFAPSSIKIKYLNNLFRIDTNEKMSSVTINDKLKMNAFYNDNMTKYNVVLNNNVIYFETYKNKLYLNSTSQAAIYNAMEVTVDYKDVAIDETKLINEIEIPIFRYFNELDLNYWSGVNE